MEVMPVRHRPRGVTILGILAVLSGIAGLLAGGLLLAAAVVVGTIAQPLKEYLNSLGYSQLAPLVTSSNVAMILALLGSLSFLVGLFWLAEGFGALRGKGWAWTVGIIIFVLSIINSIIQVALGSYPSIASLIINLGIIYYLFRPGVRAYFGKTLEPTWRPQQVTR